MAKSPEKPPQRPARDPAKHSKKDPAKPTRAKAARPELPPTAPALARLLNPGIEQGTAGPGSQTGLQPPPDNSFDRRADFAAAHRARKSTAAGFNETPQSGYVAKGVQPLGLNPELAQARCRPCAASPEPPQRSRRWSGCCARDGPNSANALGPRTVRRGRKNRKAASVW